MALLISVVHISKRPSLFVKAVFLAGDKWLQTEFKHLSCAPAGLPVFTGPIYGWKGSQNGVLLGVLGIASLPVSFLVGYISPHVSDRSLTLAAVIVTGLGAALCTQAGLRRLAVAYFGGGGMLYLVWSNPCHLQGTFGSGGRTGQ